MACLQLRKTVVATLPLSANPQALYEMFEKEELKSLAEEAFGTGDVSLKQLTTTIAKAWKAVKECAGRAGQEDGQVNSALEKYATRCSIKHPVGITFWTLLQGVVFKEGRGWLTLCHYQQ